MYYKAIANGNADTLAIWNVWNGAAWVAASVLPGASDDVYTNNFIVTVTTSQSYLSWNRSSVAAPLSITQGGQFQIDGANDILISGEIYGTNMHQTGNNPLSACVNRLATHTAKLTHIGNLVGGPIGVINYSYAFFNNSTYDLDIVGNQIAGNYVQNIALYINAAATINIVGNQIGGSGGNTAFAIYVNASAILNITGNQTGGGIINNYGIYIVSINTMSITGNQIAAVAPAVFNSATNVNLFLSGNAYASGVVAVSKFN